MATTTYTIVAGEFTVGTRSNKAKAIELAVAHRDAEKVAVQVVTSKGTVVFEQAAPKKIKMSPKYTRTVELPEGVSVPEGMRVAYFRPRRGAAVLHDAESGDYRILDTKTGKLRGPVFETTRAAGKALVQA